MNSSFVILYGQRQKIECNWTKEKCENQFLSIKTYLFFLVFFLELFGLFEFRPSSKKIRVC